MGKPILAIDPGPTESGWVAIDSDGTVGGAIEPNGQVLRVVQGFVGDAVLAIEWVESFGMAVGKDVFETVAWVGRFEQAWYEGHAFDVDWMRIPRREVKMHLCGSMKAKDPNIRQAILDRYPATGGGKTPQIGTKQKPGPLFGFKSHMFAALGVALTAKHRLQTEPASGPGEPEVEV